MRSAVLHLILSALAVWVVSRVVPGFVVDGAVPALLAAVVIGFVNATIGFALKVLTLPLGILTFGLFFLVINALMLMLTSALIPGFHVVGFAAAFIGSIVLCIVDMLLKSLAPRY